MARSGGRRLVVAFFEHPTAADAAAWLLDRRARTVGPGGSVGVLTGAPPVDLVARAGPRGGCGVGAVLGGISRALSGRDAPMPDELFGAGSNLSVDDLARFAAELEAGGALVAVLARRRGAERAILALTRCGGRAELHWITGQARAPVRDRPPPRAFPSPGT